MLHQLYVVRDRVADEASPIFSAKNDGIASRMAQNMIKNVGMFITDDYKCFHVGSFDTETMELKVFPAREVVIFDEVIQPQLRAITKEGE